MVNAVRLLLVYGAHSAMTIIMSIPPDRVHVMGMTTALTALFVKAVMLRVELVAALQKLIAPPAQPAFCIKETAHAPAHMAPGSTRQAAKPVLQYAKDVRTLKHAWNVQRTSS